MGKLTAVQVKALAKPGRFADGDNLYLQVRDASRKSWLFRYTLDGRAREMGLGAVPAVSLAEARGRAAAARAQLRDGVDPLMARRARRAAVRAIPTFREAAGSYVEAQAPAWRGPKSRAVWLASLETFAFPSIGDLPVDQVDTDAVLRVLEPIWTIKTETASRLRGRIEAILGAAKAAGQRSGENPATWRGHLSHRLAKPSKVRSVRNHPALPWQRVGEFMGELRARSGTAARALEFAILTAARSGEVLGARWREVDLAAGVWTIPAERMKASREHRVPLSAPAGALLTRAHADAAGPDGFVFPGQSPRSPLSGMALEMLVRRMNNGAEGDVPRWCDQQGRAAVPHGFRATFRTWAGEATSYPREVIEASLAHVIKDRAEAAYVRGDMLDRRRQLLEAWSAFLGQPAPSAGVVVPIRAAG